MKGIYITISIGIFLLFVVLGMKSFRLVRESAMPVFYVALLVVEAILVVIVIAQLIKASESKCPTCKKWSAVKSQKLLDENTEYKTEQVLNSETNSWETVSYNYVTKLYENTCKYCGHVWKKTKGSVKGKKRG